MKATLLISSSLLMMFESTNGNTQCNYFHATDLFHGVVGQCYSFEGGSKLTRCENGAVIFDYYSDFLCSGSVAATYPFADVYGQDADYSESCAAGDNAICSEYVERNFYQADAQCNKVSTDPMYTVTAVLDACLAEHGANGGNDKSYHQWKCVNGVATEYVFDTNDATCSGQPIESTQHTTDCDPVQGFVVENFCSSTATTPAPVSAPTEYLSNGEISNIITNLAVDEDILDDEDDIKDEIASDFLSWYTSGQVDDQWVDGCLSPYIDNPLYDQDAIKNAMIASYLKQWKRTKLKEKILEIRELMADAKVLKTQLRISAIQNAGSNDFKRAIRKAIRQKDGDSCGPTPAPTQPTFVVGENKLNWNDAKIYCQNNGLRLASIHNQHEMDMATLQCVSAHSASFNHDDGCWIGLNDMNQEGIWKYVDQSKTDFGFINNDKTNPDSLNYPWYPHEPNNYGTGEHCVQMWASKQFKWNDMFCDRINYPLCM